MRERRPALAQEPRCGREHDRADGQVDEEDPRPAQVRGQNAADQHADRPADPGGSAPHAERDVALAPFAKRGDDDRQRRRHEQRPAEPLQGPRNDQRPLRPGEPREQRAEREHGHAGNEEPPPPEQVGKPAAQEQRSAEQDRVGGNDPLQALLGEVQVVLDRRQRDEHDRNVEDDYELRRYRDGEYQPALLL